MVNSGNWKVFNFWGWILTLVSLLLVIYSFCTFRFSIFAYTWHFAPPRIFIICVAATAFILGLVGIKSRTNIARSVFTILFSVGLTLIVLMSMVAFTKMKSVHSPDGHYKIVLYSFDGGAFDSPTFYGYVDGPLWFKKEFYFAGMQHAPESISWRNNYTIAINHRKINLKAGQTYKG